MEKLLRLQDENERLKAQATGSSDEQVAHLNSLLEESQQRKEKLELENRQQSLRIVELESEVQAHRYGHCGKRIEIVVKELGGVYEEYTELVGYFV